MKRAVIVMSKAPSAGMVKTRLQPHLSAASAAELAACFLRDTVNKAKSVENQLLIVAYSPAEHREYFERLSAGKILLVEQQGADLGEKMLGAFEFACAQDADAAVMIGTDSPTFPIDYIEQAFEFLETNSDAVLGRTEDGGFYLIGLKKFDRRIFESVAWSSAKTFERTRRNIMNLGWHLREVPGWYDVDEPRDLEQLKTELLKNKNAQRRAPLTFEWIKRELG